jgi:hypothetical protein
MSENDALHAYGGAGSVIVWDTGTYDNRTKDPARHAVSMADEK